MFDLEILLEKVFYEMYFINSNSSSLCDDALLYIQHWPLFQILIVLSIESESGRLSFWMTIRFMSISDDWWLLTDFQIFFHRFLCRFFHRFSHQIFDGFFHRFLHQSDRSEYSFEILFGNYFSICAVWNKLKSSTSGLSFLRQWRLDTIDLIIKARAQIKYPHRLNAASLAIICDLTFFFLF